MPAINSALKLPPTALLIPGAVVALASVLLLAILLVQGRALRDDAATAQSLPRPAAGDDAPLKPTAPAANLAPLANSELFGHYDPSAATSPAGSAHKPGPAELGKHAPEALPEATLALKLQGIVYQPDPAQRRAIIAGDGPNPLAHKIGETLLGDAVIRYIERRRVVVEQQGELKALSLTETALGHSGAPTPGADGAADNPFSGPSALFAAPPPAGRRGAIEAMPQPQPYQAPDEPAETAQEEADPGAQDYESPPDDPAPEPDASEPTE